VGAPSTPEPPGDVLDAVLRLGPRVAARSAGAGPVEVATADGARTRVPVRAVTVVDTLGAGDVLHGALAARLAVSPLPGPATAPLPDVVAALAWAAGVASASCAAVGVRGWAGDPVLLARLRQELDADHRG
jgi:sugar/nucleoside kinase (ribokinase family)